MKSKKKMLLALGAMSAAAIGAGATSTFAWYRAQSQTGIASSFSKEAISVSDPEKGIGATAYLDVTVSRLTADGSNSANLELATFDSTLGGADNLKHAYLDASNRVHYGADKIAASGTVAYAWYKVTIKTTTTTIGGQSYSALQTAQELQNGSKKLEVKVYAKEKPTFTAATAENSNNKALYLIDNGTSSAPVKWHECDEAATTASRGGEFVYTNKYILTDGAATRAKMWVGASSTAAAPSEAGAAPITLRTSGTLSNADVTALGGNGLDLYFGLYVEGVNGTETEGVADSVDTGTVSGSFLVDAHEGA